MVLHRDVILSFAKGKRVQRYLERIAEAGAAGARRRVAVDTGNLRDHIEVESGPGFARWGVNGVDYAIPQEYGTWKMKAHPFMRPSVTDAVREAAHVRFDS
jgi:hypothetical protein